MNALFQGPFLLTVLFSMMIGSVGIIQAAIEIARGERPAVLDLFTQTPTARHLRSFEKSIETTSWFAQTLQPAFRYLQFVILKDAGEKAVAGREGCFFYKPAVEYLIQPLDFKAHSGNPDDPLPAIVDFKDQLAARGIHLLVMIAPNKASIYPEKLTRRAEGLAEPVNHHTRRLMERLRDADVALVDLFNAYEKDKTRPVEKAEALYLMQDSHWSPRGMQLAAWLTAKRMLDAGWIQPGTVEYDVKPVPLNRYGDILNMMRLPWLDTLYAPETIQCEQVIHSGTGETCTDDPAAPVLVLGDSFLRIYERDEPGSGGFTAHLARELRRRVAAIINDGGASTLVRQELSRKHTLLADKRVVVWEFAEREIRFGLEGWKKISLPET
ncbi:MAG TPA: hypothetical protein PLH79_00620 [bacterium]|nr:hypothetical protein [bacterium]HPP02563.1 hypothetical protein [bacterium]